MVISWISVLVVYCLPCELDASTSGSAKLAAIVDEFYTWRVQAWPEYGTKFSINTFNDRIDVYTEQAFLEQKINASEFLNRVSSIESEELETQEQFSKEILESILKVFINGYEFRVHGIYSPMVHAEYQMFRWINMVGNMPKSTMDDFENILERLRAIPVQIQQIIELMRIGINQDITRHWYDIENGLNAITEELGKEVTESNFYKIFKSDVLPETVNKSSLQSTCKEVIELDIHPGLRVFKAFLEDEYTPHLRPQIGVGSLPSGQEFYESCLQWHLGPDVNAEQVHALGLEEVQRIEDAVSDLIVKSGFQGSMQEYIIYLNQQPEQYYSTSEEVLDGYREIIGNMHNKLGRVLKHVPNIPLVVRLSANSGDGYTAPSRNGDPGVFHANAKHPEDIPKYLMVSLALHEAEPGHHTQGSYAAGSKLPSFRTNIEFLRYNAVPFNWPFQTAYSEGWALYAEYLGEALGAYDEDPTTLFGRYVSELLRAARLVVDTGIHAKGWSFDEAVEYFQNHTALAERKIQFEIKRYIGWPGQACAYKYGELKIRKLRKRAEDAFGEDFDEREFHDIILSFGDAPLSVLDKAVNVWIVEADGNAASAYVVISLDVYILLTFLSILIAWH